MIALDTNVLVHARRTESIHHQAAVRLVDRLATGDEPWALPWPCVYEFLRVVTHPRVFDPPSRMDTVLDDLETLLDSPSLAMLGEGPAHASHMLRAIDDSRAVGNLAHDAHIAALLLEHGVREFWTADRDFARFPDLRTLNPFVPSTGERRGRYRSRRRSSRQD